MSLPYSDLSPDQQARAEYLFCDSVFGTDPAAYLYDVAGDQVTGRSAIARSGEPAVKAGRRSNTGSRITVMLEAHTTPALLQSALDHWDLYLEDLARQLVINCQMAANEIQSESITGD